MFQKFMPEDDLMNGALFIEQDTKTQQSWFCDNSGKTGASLYMHALHIIHWHWWMDWI